MGSSCWGNPGEGWLWNCAGIGPLQPMGGARAAWSVRVPGQCLLWVEVPVTTQRGVQQQEL